MIDRFDFDSKPLGQKAGFEAYRALYARGTDAIRTDGPFLARVQGVRLEGLLLFERRLSGVAHVRDADRVARDHLDHFVLHLVLDGALQGAEESGFDWARPGDLVVGDLTRPSSTRAHDLHVLTASLPRAAMIASDADLSRLHGRMASAPRTLAVRDLILSIVRNAEVLPAKALGSLARAVTELLIGALDVAGAQTSAARLDLLRREMAVRYIAAHLSDRGLDAARVAEGAGLSRSALYRLFSANGGVAEFIMSRRLGAVRDMLERGSTAPLATLATAYGFADESHLNRRFSRAYGQPAGAFRRSLAETLGDNARSWTSWLVEMG